MVRVLKGNKRDMPTGMTPFEWANEVFAVMDDRGVDQVEAKRIVQERHNDDQDDEED